jgi:hypothetical protein
MELRDIAVELTTAVKRLEKYPPARPVDTSALSHTCGGAIVLV